MINEDNFLGMLYGYVIGDITGSIVEGLNIELVRKYYKYPITEYVSPVTNFEINKIGQFGYRTKLLNMFIQSHINCNENVSCMYDEFKLRLKSELEDSKKSDIIVSNDPYLSVLISSILTGSDMSHILTEISNESFLLIIAIMFSFLIDDYKFLDYFERNFVTNLKLIKFNRFLQHVSGEQIFNLHSVDKYNLLYESFNICKESKIFSDGVTISINDYPQLCPELSIIVCSVLGLKYGKSNIESKYLENINNINYINEIFRKFIDNVKTDIQK